MASGRFSLLLALIRLAACSAGVVAKYYVPGTSCATPLPEYPRRLNIPKSFSTSAPMCFAYDDANPALPVSWGTAGKTASLAYLNETHGHMKHPCTGNCSSCLFEDTFQFGDCIARPGLPDWSLWPSTGVTASASVSVGLATVAVNFNPGHGEPSTCETIQIFPFSNGNLWSIEQKPTPFVVKCGECLECEAGEGWNQNNCHGDFKGSFSKYCTQAGDFADLILFSGANCSGAVTIVPNTQCEDVKNLRLGRRDLIVHAHQMEETINYDSADCTGPVNRHAAMNMATATSQDCISVNRSHYQPMQFVSQSEQWDICFRTQRYFYSADCSGNPVHEFELEPRIVCENSEACLPGYGGKSQRKVRNCSLPCTGCGGSQKWCGWAGITSTTTAKAGATTKAGSTGSGTTKAPAKKTYTTSATVETSCADARQIVNNATAGKDAFKKALETSMGVLVKDTKIATMGCPRLTNNSRRLSTTGIKADFTYESATNKAVPSTNNFQNALKSNLKAAGLPDAVTVSAITAPVEQTTPTVSAAVGAPVTPTVSAAVGAPVTIFFVAMLSAGISW